MAEITRRYGVSRARVSQIMKLLNLAPVIQESVPLGHLDVGERTVHKTRGELTWERPPRL